MNAQEKQDEMQRRIAACVNAFDGIPTERIEGKNLGEILAAEMRLHGAGPRADGGFGFEFSGGVCQLLAEAYADQFKQSGAINYLELLFQHSDVGPLTITMQRVEGLTPAQKLAQAEGERDALQAKLAEHEENSMFGHLEKCSEIVARWPEWKRNGADAIKFIEGLDEFEVGYLNGHSEACKNRPAPAINLAELAPEGWKLVPIEPTERMVIDGFESEPSQFFSEWEEWDKYSQMSGCQQAAYKARLCWSAMIDAAPTPSE